MEISAHDDFKGVGMSSHCKELLGWLDNILMKLDSRLEDLQQCTMDLKEVQKIHVGKTQYQVLWSILSDVVTETLL